MLETLAWTVLTLSLAGLVLSYLIPLYKKRISHTSQFDFPKQKPKCWKCGREMSLAFFIRGKVIVFTCTCNAVLIFSTQRFQIPKEEIPIKLEEPLLEF